MAREIKSNNKDHQQASVDTQRDYYHHKILHNVIKSKTVTEKNTQPSKNQQEKEYEKYMLEEKADSYSSTNKVEKVDFDTFILDKKKVAEAEQEKELKELFQDKNQKYTPKEFTHIPEKLLRKRVLSYGTLYFAKWQGLPKTANTWEKLEDLEVNYQNLIEKFEQKYKQQKEIKKKIFDAKQNAWTPDKQEEGEEELILDKDEVNSPKKFTNIPEKVLGMIVYDDVTLCLVKWHGLSKTSNTWEKLEDLEHNHQGIIDKFKQKYKLQEDKKKKKLIVMQNERAPIEELSAAKPQALNLSVTQFVPQTSSKSGKYTKEDIQEMLGRHTLDNEVVYSIKLKGQSEVKYVQKKDLDCPDLIKEADRKYQEKLKAKSQDIGRSKRRQKMNS